MPSTRKGKIKIKDFLHLPILSEEAFRAIDRYILCVEREDHSFYEFPFFYLHRNRDGFITLGELKLANKNFSIRDISKVRVGIIRRRL